MIPLSSLPASARRAIYDIAWVVGIILGALSAFYGKTASELPAWLVGANAAFGFIFAAVGILARSNTADVEAQSDGSSPTGAVAGPASDIPEGDPVVVAPATRSNVVHLSGEEHAP